MGLPDDLPRRPAAEGARRVALALLEDVELESARLGDAGDDEGLHDFRVALRRLRSTLRTWRRELDESVRKPDLRALRDLQESTGAGRDAQVALAWLEACAEQLAEGERGELDRIVARMRERLAATHGPGADELRARLAAVAERLRARLPRRLAVLHIDRPMHESSWAQALAAAAQREADALTAALEGAAGPDDRERLHAGRIQGKRLRYLLEPARSWSKTATRLVTRLKKLQDVLGEIQDAHVLAAELEPQAAADRSPGLATLERLNRQRLVALFERLQEAWLSGGLAQLCEDVRSFGAAFAALGRRDLERERKYLLDGLPVLPAGGETWEIEQGWLPGDRLRERLRRVSGAGVERHERALKLGAGVERIEIEEPLAQELFEALWPLTDGCRVRKRRHRVRVGAHVWEVDEFLDRNLVLVEVELETADERPQPPPWLAAHVVREVTDEGSYTNLALAESGPGAVPD